MNNTNANTETAIFASGCFWGTEFYFHKAVGVISATSGYTGGHTENPSYSEVCSGSTGHAEAVEVVFDAALTSYENLVKLFFETHNPAHKNRQGPDIGHQYRSAVFYKDEQQKSIAENIINTLREKDHEVVTEVTRAGVFYKAEDKHQQYYIKKGGNPYCHRYVKKF
jgi:peptide methionine sulfoxide reductase msrA/msrB